MPMRSQNECCGQQALPPVMSFQASSAWGGSSVLEGGGVWSLPYPQAVHWSSLKPSLQFLVMNEEEKEKKEEEKERRKEEEEKLSTPLFGF